MSIKSIRSTLIILFLLIPHIGTSQVSFLPLNADYAAFRMNDSLAYVEFYVSFFQNNIQYYNINDTLTASFSTTLNIEYEDSLYYTKTHQFENKEVDTLNVQSYNSFLDIFTLALPFRKFTANIILKDLNSNYSGEYLLNLNIPGPSDQFSLSDIQLSSGITKQEKKTEFTKNGLEVTPHPRRTYDVLNPMLYYYVELNNLSVDKEKENDYSVNYFVTDQNGDTVRTGNPKTVKIIAKNQVEIGAFNAYLLPNGVYFLNIRAVDNASKKTSNIKKKFLVFKAKQEQANVEQKAEVDPVYNAMSLEELQREMDVIKYIARTDEQDIISQLDSLQAMRKFLTTFWSIRDKNSQNNIGESRRKYLALVDEANERFRHGSEEGWETDRGRVLISYGQPDEIERYPNTLDGKPHSIWKYYQLESGAGTIFVFYDRMGFGNYELLHSTYYKELQNPDWQNIIQNSTSRF